MEIHRPDKRSEFVSAILHADDDAKIPIVGIGTARARFFKDHENGSVKIEGRITCFRHTTKIVLLATDFREWYSDEDNHPAPRQFSVLAGSDV